MTFKKIFMLLSIFFLTTSCGKKDDNSSDRPIFGEFGCYGNYLYTYTDQVITPVEAKSIASKTDFSKQVSMQSASNRTVLTPLDIKPSSDIVDYYLSNFSECEITTKYYTSDDSNPKYKVNNLRGTDFRSIIEQNEFSPFSQVGCKYLVAFAEIIDVMEEYNEEFKQLDNYNIYPFKDIFTYGKRSDGCLVIQTRDFAEIPESVGGGIANSYRQDTEIIYDADNKISKRQSSLGIYIATPEGTMKTGYILEVNFNWIEKSAE